MAFVPWRIAYFGNHGYQGLLFIKTVKHVNGAKIETEMPQLRQHAYRSAKYDAGLLLYQLVYRIHHRHRSVAKVIVASKGGRSEAIFFKAPARAHRLVNLREIQVGP